MPRDRTARARIQHLLTTRGAIVNASGYATNELMDAVSYQGSLVGFVQLMAAMERDGEVVRDIRGKRTYSIAASPATLGSIVRRPGGEEHPVLTVPEVPEIAIDYDRLAQAVLRELVRRATETSPTYAERLADARLRIDLLLGAAEDRVTTAARRA